MTAKPTIRAAAPGDARHWERMRERLWPSEPGEHAREVAAYFGGDRRVAEAVLLALDGADPVGFAEASIRPYAEGCHSGRVAYLEGLWVDEAKRGRGIAAALVAAVEAWARSRGLTELASDAEVENAGSIAMHRALGFDEVERIVCFRKDL